MRNIVIYSTKPMPEIQAILSEIDDAEVRMVSVEQIKEYAVINPSFIFILLLLFLLIILLLVKISVI